MSRKMLLAGAIGLGLLAAASAHADVFVTSSGSGGFVSGATSFSGSNCIGWQMMTGANPLQVTALGFWDFEANGLEVNVEVGIWQTGAVSLLASVTVPAGTGATLINDFRFVNLGTAIVLQPNTLYTLGYRRASGGVLRDADNRVGQTFAAGATITIPRMNDSGFGQPFGSPFGPMMPVANLGGSVPLTGPNFQFTIVPTPGAAAVLGMVGLAATRRRRRA
ncbi:MAG: hypothetical protein ACREJO_01450 [Phycisphaerales bacterium]